MMKIISLLLAIGWWSTVGITIGAPTVDEYLNQLKNKQVIPGFSVVIVKENRVIFEKGFGTRSVNDHRPVTPYTCMATGSLVKSFTALAMMQLVEQGKVRLDDPIISYLPWFRTENKSTSDLITIRMLLNNTSGLSAPTFRNRWVSENAAENLAHSMESVYLTVTPGTKYQYSNEGFALAGLIIEKVTGLPYDTYMKEYVYRPLEMTRTTDDPWEFDSLDVLYGHYPGISNGIPAQSSMEDLLNEYKAAGSILRSTADDIGHYLIALLNEGKYDGKQIISPESLTLMWTPYASFPGISIKEGGNDLPFHYGLGWFTGILDGKYCIFHGGNRRTMSSMTLLYPEKRIGISILSNLELTGIDRYRYPNLVNIADNLIRLSLGEQVSDFALPKTPDPTKNDYHLPDSLKNRYTGEYLLTEGNDWIYTGSQLSISFKNGNLTATIHKDNQILDRFAIDFITPRTAVSRNIMMPRRIYFKFMNETNISGIYIGNLKYSKLSEGYYRDFNRQTSPDKRLSFLYSKKWDIKWSGTQFYGQHVDGYRETILGRGFMDNTSSIRYFTALFPKHRIVHTGKQFSEVLGGRYWTETALVSSEMEKPYWHLVCTTRKAGVTYVIVFTTPHDLTGRMTRIIPMLLTTFTW